ncbi:calcium-binding protein [Enterovibrio norvegicus]|uniref:calcium-binding protein n=5 Tax=Enterovibrio norvegicus TaxID=188144 RepID=UPI000C85308E|nr:calcium-binding protein [Enterovibrio norvegicus]MCC4797365.1 calcium-binding protein [Enterovibrio norvegicus]PMH66714.1 calcium-binding protein [Enterovibrio norvegicus]PMI27084.1 calcium-binding protein [Enterovibrio norvegicus]PMI40201.1 calcium-binding protein [Enterovibrio norvegicus]PMN56040.1 calcium-binding protein [Enterovibrio norvegicus]
MADINGTSNADTLYGDIGNGDDSKKTGAMFVMGADFTMDSGNFHTWSFPPKLNFTGSTTDVTFNDDDGQLNGDDRCNERSDDKSQTVDIGGQEYSANVDFSLKYCDSDGNIYTFAIVDIDADGNGHHYCNVGENGKILIQIDGPEITGDTDLSLVPNSYQNVSSLNYADITEPQTVDPADLNDTIVGGDGDDTIFGLKGEDHISGENGNDKLYGGDGDDIIYGNTATPNFSEDPSVTVFQMGADFDMPAGGNFHTWSFPKDLSFDGGSTDVTFQDDDGVLNGDNYCNEYSDDKSQTVTIDGNTYPVNLDYTLKYCDSDGNVYTFAILDVDLDGNGHHYNNLNENGNLLLQLDGPEITDATDLSLVPHSYKNLNELDYDDVANATTQKSNDNDYIDGGEGNDTIYGQWGDDEIYGGEGNDTIYGGQEATETIETDPTASVFIMGDDFEMPSGGNFHTWSFPQKLAFDGGTSEVTFQDDDGVLNGDNYCNEYSDDKSQSVTIDGNTYAVNLDYTLKYCDAAGNVYKFAIIDVDLDGNRHHYYNLDENGKILLQIEGPEITDATDLTLVPHSYENLRDLDYSEFAETTKEVFVSDNDTISGGAGDDYIHGGDGDDLINGDEGDDNLIGGKGNDTIYGGAGDDVINGSQGDDILYGGDGDDKLFGASGDDSLYGGAGNDVLQAGFEDDIIMDGGEDQDLYIGSEGNDTMIFDQDDFTDADFLAEHNTIYVGDRGFDKILVDGDANIDFSGKSYGVTSGPKPIAQVEAVVASGEGDQTVTVNAFAIQAQSDNFQTTTNVDPGDWDGFVAYLGEGNDTFNLEALNWNYDADAPISAELSADQIAFLGLNDTQVGELDAYVFTRSSGASITVWTDAENFLQDGEDIFSM